MWLILLLLIFSTSQSVGKNAALVLARGGSKGVHLKNLQTVGGVSLLARSIQTAKIAGLEVTVSTDHPLIALETLRNEAVVFHRSKVTATDWAPSIWAAAEFVATRPDVTVLVLIQATSPFLKAESLRKAIDKIHQYDCVFSVTRSFKLRWRENNGKAEPLNFNPSARPRRQDWNGEVLETGAFYMSRRALIEQERFQNNNCSVIEVSAVESLEVDSPHDLQVANALHKVNLA
ncbi:cytidylyltransferase domain-containing protein [Phthorimaea operculella]|nr:cytidylyltransferase domain-containing protein [Phthorimaea operculella]